MLAGGSHATMISSSNSGSDGSNSKCTGSLAVGSNSNGEWGSQQERAAAAHAAEAVSARIKALPDGEREALLVKVRLVPYEGRTVRQRAGEEGRE